MGWTFPCYNTRVEIIDFLTSPTHWAPHKLLMHRLVGSNLWTLYEDQGIKQIALFLIAFERGHGYGYKDIHENAGPCHHNCPRTFIEAASPTSDPFAVDFRKRALAFSTAQKAAPEPIPGLVVSIQETQYTLVSSLGRKGWKVIRNDTQTHYRMTSRQLKECLMQLAK